MKFFIGDSLKIPDFAKILSSILSTIYLFIADHNVYIITCIKNLCDLCLIKSNNFDCDFELNNHVICRLPFCFVYERKLICSDQLIS